MQGVNSYLESVLLSIQNPNIAKDAITAILRANGIDDIKLKKVVQKHILTSQKIVTGLSQQNFFNELPVNPVDEHMVVYGIKLLSGANAAVLSTAWTPGISDAIALNGLMDLSVNGTLLMKDMPLTTVPSSTNNADLNAGFIILDRPVLIPANGAYVVTLKFPTLVATASFNIKVHLEGIKLI